MTRRDVEPTRAALYQTAVSSSGRSGTIAAVAASLAFHAAVGVWFALRPPMFRPVRQAAPIEVALIPAPPPEPEPAGGGGAEPLVREPPPDRSSQPRPKALRRPAPERRSVPPPPALPAPKLPAAAVVDSGPAIAAPQGPEDLAVADVTAGDLGIGTGGGQGPGSGGGSGGGVGSGVGPGSGSGRGGEVKPREIRRPSYAEMRDLYPEEARREGLQARVRLLLLVDTRGRVADVRVVRGAGHGFDEAAMDLARRFLFEPGRRDGRPVSMWITLTYSFEIEG